MCKNAPHSQLPHTHVASRTSLAHRDCGRPLAGVYRKYGCAQAPVTVLMERFERSGGVALLVCGGRGCLGLGLAATFSGVYGEVAFSATRKRASSAAGTSRRKEVRAGQRVQYHMCPIWRAKYFKNALYRYGIDLKEFDGLEFVFTHAQVYSFEELDRIAEKISKSSLFRGPARPSSNKVGFRDAQRICHVRSAWLVPHAPHG